MSDGTVKFIDFGIVRTYKKNQGSDTVILGTRGYAPPEQYNGQTDARTDIYGLGMTMVRLVTGINPLTAPGKVKPICWINPDLPKEFERIISKCTQPDPARRYQNCGELMLALEKCLEHLHKKKGFFQKYFGKKPHN